MLKYAHICKTIFYKIKQQKTDFLKYKFYVILRLNNYIHAQFFTTTHEVLQMLPTSHHIRGEQAIYFQSQQ